MKKNTGIWIDHSQAIIVSIVDDSEEIFTIGSKVEKHPGFTGGNRKPAGYGPSYSASESKYGHKQHGVLHQYYQEVIGAVKDADHILIMGPGEAKVELEKEIKKTEKRDRVLFVETVDKMTLPQLKARVKKFFNVQVA
ncbi:MAG: hypothetical protein PHV30_10065 [Candidatus Margulisbacteria bacterium]|nr:hypothetical protein [Candidatus Margulisiibacteriota bacterium]